MTADQQLEWFADSAPRRPVRRGTCAVSNLSLRADHVVLLAMVGLVGASVVFALGVERGKQLARSERTVLEAPIAHLPVPSPEAPPLQSPARPPSAPIKPGASPQRFAIQVVSYRQPVLAKRELQRLQQLGERAFLVTRQGRVALLVGPFQTKTHAATKLTRLKRQYQDCFVRPL